MVLPLSAAPQYLHIEPTRQFVLFSQASRNPIKIISVVNEAARNHIIQPVISAQPGWSSSAFTGPYASRNLADTSGLLFNGAQYMRYDALAPIYSGLETGLTIMCNVSCSLPSSGLVQTVWAFGGSGSTPTLSLQYQSGNITFKEVSSSGTTTVSAAIDNNIYTVTCVRSAGSLSLRLDTNTPVTSSIATSISSQYSTFAIGALNSSGSISNYFNGAIGTIIAYGTGGNGVAADVSKVTVTVSAQAGKTKTNTPTAGNK